MKSMAATLIIAGGMLVGTLLPSHAATLNTMDDVGAAIQACWTPPPDAGDSTVTLSFSFKRDGTLIGAPRPTAAKVAGDDKARKSFIDAAVAAVKNCTPLTFSPTLAQGIGGNVFTLQFVSPKK
ncbi:cell envelope integrity protein TolA [Mesorhizobium sp. B2-4-15]|uniref:cell envelope integrity protein TolA n=1 Tax=unclassified Mesorhizobium TaxID=325217 RepID=UPI00112E7E2B|nr:MULTISPECIES: cell envelope integrity protein TolA [unclassified Mesorhizobium]TPK77268.1 cell envelope integrity protein TolA [Mesorhizobium sp. B2-4-15]TPM31778.1 cell envelope integrity protein TolA [Mesorhizobium sp. B2-3-5]